jgi:hypothetical protein
MTRVRSPQALAHLSLAVCGGLVLVAAGQPLNTDDLWWHLALGRVFAAHGPWLADDPLLFAPAAPPSPASWLSDLGLAALAHTAGFYALRVLLVASVAAILALAWSLLRRASGSRAFASLGTAVFAALAAYRLLQLRPDLVSIAATLLCYRWLIADEQPPSVARIAAVGALSALWANLHAGFPLGLLAIGAAVAGLVLAAPLRSHDQRRGDRARALRLAAALGVAALATLANPAGIGAHLAYLAAGRSTPALERVRDEWAPLHLFALPTPPQPSVLSWLLAWGLLVALGWVVARWIAREPVRRALDPAKLALALLAIGLLLTAVRFLWLGIFPLLVFAELFRTSSPELDRRPRAARRRAVWIGAAACLVAVGFVKVGDRLITREAMLRWYYYQRPYPPAKYHATAIWLLADSGVRGNLYHEYFLGGFAGYWLAPGVRSLANGTLNVPTELLDAVAAIAVRKGLRPGEEFTALLDRLGIDLFLGIRMPEPQIAGDTWSPTAAHLENTPGWIPIYRNLSCAIYLRASERNRVNIDRLADYYAGQGVPFDRERGFDVDAVVRDAPGWAVAHQIVPYGFARMARDTVAHRADVATQDRVARIWAVLGRYERAIAIDRALVRAAPEPVHVWRRLTWSLLRLGRFDEASEAAKALERQPADDELSHWIADAAREVPALDPERARARVSGLPMLARAEASALQASLEPTPPRPAR